MSNSYENVTRAMNILDGEGSIQERLASADRPPGVPDHYVPIHGDITPVNVRMDTKGQVWLVDWDKVDWGPPLGDELRHWLSEYGRRLGPARYKARRAASHLFARGTREQLVEALEWREALRGEEKVPADHAVRVALRKILVPDPH